MRVCVNGSTGQPVCEGVSPELCVSSVLSLRFKLFGPTFIKLVQSKKSVPFRAKKYNEVIDMIGIICPGDLGDSSCSSVSITVKKKQKKC